MSRRPTRPLPSRNGWIVSKVVGLMKESLQVCRRERHASALRGSRESGALRPAAPRGGPGRGSSHGNPGFSSLSGAMWDWSRSTWYCGRCRALWLHLKRASLASRYVHWVTAWTALFLMSYFVLFPTKDCP